MCVAKPNTYFGRMCGKNAKFVVIGRGASPEAGEVEYRTSTEVCSAHLPATTHRTALDRDVVTVEVQVRNDAGRLFPESK